MIRMLAAAAVLFAAPVAHAHEMRHLVERSRAIAVKVYDDDGDVLANARFEIYSPADARTPRLEGRTDPGGWLAFVPDVPGAWRVKVVGDDGHGIDVGVQASAPAAAASPTGTSRALRPLAGALAIVAVFALLVAGYRRRKAR